MPYDRGVLLYAKPFKTGVFTGLIVSLLFIVAIAGSAANADKFDPFAIYSEALPFNDKWEACGVPLQL
jgi:hypothetical protein